MSETVLKPNIAEHRGHVDKTILGFWVYLMTDLIMFAGLFAVFAVLRNNTFGGPSSEELFSLPLALTETLLLLTSSFTCGLAVLAMHKGNKKFSLIWFFVTFVLGFAFLFMELKEFHQLLAEGSGPDRSAFLSSYFTLVGTHGLHIAVGLLWLVVGMIMLWKKGPAPAISSKLTRLGLFWHFLDLVWIFIFAIVYLIGVL